MTPIALATGQTVTLTLSQSQSLQFWPADGSCTVDRTATNLAGTTVVRTYGPGVFRHTTAPFTGTIRLDATKGPIYYVLFGADPA